MCTERRNTLGFGGGCHWCTEAVFKSVKSVLKVKQGWIDSLPPYQTFSEAVVVTYNPDAISIKKLIRIHLHTHSSTSKHSMRYKYRSAVYYFKEVDAPVIKAILKELQTEFKKPIITQVLPFYSFKPSEETYQNYYKKNPDKPFCKLYIDPKLERIKKLVN